MEFDSGGKGAGARTKGRERILFVDDEELFVKMGSRLLEQQGYEVTYKTDSTEALELFHFQPENFDLVITDHNMPGMTGMELARKLLDVRPDIPIILCTASSHISEQDVLKQGIGKFLLKPLDSMNLAVTIREMLDRKETAPAWDKQV